MKDKQTGMVSANEAYSKSMLLERLGISQKFWDKLLDDGLPFANVGHTRWVSGRQLIEHLEKHSTTKHSVAQ
jgi:hypothetical protein